LIALRFFFRFQNSDFILNKRLFLFLALFFVSFFLFLFSTRDFCKTFNIENSNKPMHPCDSSPKKEKEEREKKHENKLRKPEHSFFLFNKISLPLSLSRRPNLLPFSSLVPQAAAGSRRALFFLEMRK